MDKRGDSLSSKKKQMIKSEMTSIAIDYLVKCCGCEGYEWRAKRDDAWKWLGDKANKGLLEL